MGQKNNEQNFSEYDFLCFFFHIYDHVDISQLKKKSERKSIKTQCGINAETK